MRNHLRMATLLFASIALGSGAAFAHDDKMQMEMHHHGPPPAACQTIALACASVATGAFGPDGKLWVTWSAGGRVSVASSSDLGKSFSAAVTLPARNCRSMKDPMPGRRSWPVPGGASW